VSDVAADTTFVIYKLGGSGAQGEKGDTGATGSGTSINVKDEGTDVTNTPHSTLNFKGDGVTVTDAGSGVAEVTIDGGGGGGIFGSEYDYAESEGQSSTSSTSYQQKLRMTTATIPSGTYRISWSFEWSCSSDRTPASGFIVELDGTTALSEVAMAPQKNYGDGCFYTSSGFKHTSLTAVSHTIDINFKGGVGTAYIRNARIEFWRIS